MGSKIKWDKGHEGKQGQGKGTQSQRDTRAGGRGIQEQRGTITKLHRGNGAQGFQGLKDTITKRLKAKGHNSKHKDRW